MLNIQDEIYRTHFFIGRDIVLTPHLMN